VAEVSKDDGILATRKGNMDPLVAPKDASQVGCEGRMGVAANV
jgi:hypothetical protein